MKDVVIVAAVRTPVGKFQGAFAEMTAVQLGAVAVRELADVSRRADNPALLGALPDFGVDVATLVSDVEAERAGR